MEAAPRAPAYTHVLVPNRAIVMQINICRLPHSQVSQYLQRDYTAYLGIEPEAMLWLFRSLKLIFPDTPASAPDLEPLVQAAPHFRRYFSIPKADAGVSLAAASFTPALWHRRRSSGCIGRGRAVGHPPPKPQRGPGHGSLR